MYLNGEEQAIDVGPQIINDRIYLPVRYMFELFEGNVSTHSYLKPKQPSNTVYVVKKVFTDSGISTSVRF